MPQKAALEKATDKLLAIIHTCMACSLVYIAIEWWQNLCIGVMRI